MMANPPRQVASVHLLVEHEYESPTELISEIHSGLAHGKPITVLAIRWELNGAVSSYVQEGVNVLRGEGKS